MEDISLNKLIWILQEIILQIHHNHKTLNRYYNKNNYLLFYGF